MDNDVTYLRLWFDVGTKLVEVFGGGVPIDMVGWVEVIYLCSGWGDLCF